MVFLISLVNATSNDIVQTLSGLLLSARPRQSLTSLATAVKEMEEIPAYLPSGAVLKDAVQRARDWLQDVEALQVGLQQS